MPASLSPVHGGYTPAARFVAQCGERRAFVKAATTPYTAAALRREITSYEALASGPRPKLLGFDADRTLPILIIEDLSDATWPPPWTDGTVSAAIAAIRDLHEMQADLPPFMAVRGQDVQGWATVRADPGAFLALGLVSWDWLQKTLPALIEAEAACETAGMAPTHQDLRSDNMCLAAGAMKFIDWSEACLSNPRLDLGFWLPSLAYEAASRGNIAGRSRSGRLGVRLLRGARGIAGDSGRPLRSAGAARATFNGVALGATSAWLVRATATRFRVISLRRDDAAHGAQLHDQSKTLSR